MQEPPEQTLGGLPATDFLGVPMLRCTTAEFMSALTERAKLGDPADPAFVTYLNAWCFLVAGGDPDYASILRAGDGVYADGQAVVWASRWCASGGVLPERVNAADFIPDFLRGAVARGLRIRLLGSESGVAARAAERFRAEVPGLLITGADDGYFTDGGEEAVVARIAADAPDLLLVGMGVPLQEKWAWTNRARLNCRAVWCVGAMFEYYGGARARAPVWTRKAGLEWLFRLFLEPRRLWRRYLLGNARFVIRVAGRVRIR